MNVRAFSLLGLALLGGCASPRHLQYDFGRAYTAAFSAQTDLARPSAANADHPLQGVEAASIRSNATAATTDKESAQTTLTTSVK